MPRFDSKEYTRLRDIVQKRMKRAVSAGLMAPVHFPTVKEIRSGLVSPEVAFKAVQGYYSSGSQVKAIRQTGLVPQIESFPTLIKTRELEEARKQRQREKRKEYRRYKKVKESTTDIQKRKDYVHYLKALEGLNKIWKKAGRELGLDVNSMSPSEAVAFVEYMQYRFSQGDYTQKYMIDVFIEDYATLVREKNYSPYDITKDFDKFLADRKQLDKEALTMEGITEEEMAKYWTEFIGD